MSISFTVISVLISFFMFSNSVEAKKQQPLALIYKGPGSCEQYKDILGCSEAAREIALMAGFKVQFVGPTEIIGAEMAKTAKLWIQPGGRAKIQEKTMSKELKQSIVEFVKNGGAYVGFCAGGFLATEKFGWEDKKNGPFEAFGFGFLPGKSWYYDLFDEELNENLLAKIIPTTWNGLDHNVYWELGPYFLPSSVTKETQIISYYKLKDHSNDLEKIMTLYSMYFKGKVAVTAVHPEAPQSWRDYYKITDPDKEDFKLGVDMIKWATSK